MQLVPERTSAGAVDELGQKYDICAHVHECDREVRRDGLRVDLMSDIPSEDGHLVQHQPSLSAVESYASEASSASGELLVAHPRNMLFHLIIRRHDYPASGQRLEGRHVGEGADVLFNDASNIVPFK
jgi:hypothetical protein